MVSAEAPADHAARMAERIRGRRNDILVSMTQRQRLEPYSLLYVAKSMKWKSILDAGGGKHLLHSASNRKRIRGEDGAFRKCDAHHGKAARGERKLAERSSRRA